jgi:hypothetical protein
MLAFTMNFFRNLEPIELDIPIPFASNIISIFGFLLILTLTTMFVFDASEGEYAPIDVEDGSLDMEIGDIEMMLSDESIGTKRRVSMSRIGDRDGDGDGGSDRNNTEGASDGGEEINKKVVYDALSSTYLEKYIISFSMVSVLMYLNFFIGFWFSTKEHIGYKDLVVAIFNHCLLVSAQSAVLASLYRPTLPSFFWPLVVCLSCSVPLGILMGSYYSVVYGDNADASSLKDPFMHKRLKVLIHLGLCLCRGVLVYISTICMISHAIVNKNYDRSSNVLAVLCGSLLFCFMNEI